MREWVRQQLHSNNFHTCTIFQRTQEASKLLEENIQDAQSRMNLALQQTAETTGVLVDLNKESDRLRDELKQEVRQIAAYVDNRLS